MTVSVLLDSRAQPVRSPLGKTSPSMGGGVAGLAGLHALEDRKQDGGSVTIQLLKTGGAPAPALLRRHWPVREAIASSR